MSSPFKIKLLDRILLKYLVKAIKKKWKGLQKMDETKPWWKSKTVLGAMVQIGISVAMGLFGLDQLEGEKEQITLVLLSFANALDGAWNIYGRVTATKLIKP